MEPVETSLFMLTKLDGAVVMKVVPATVAGGLAAGAVVAAPALDTGAAMAIALRTVATPIRRVRVGFMAHLPFKFGVHHIPLVE
jgi:hypothetical protein